MEDQNVEVHTMDDFADEINKTFTKLQVGDIVEGKVLSVTDTEVFVNIGYFSDGIISAEEVTHEVGVSIKELIKTDDTIKAEILTLNDGEGNVLLSIKKAEEVLIWDELEDTYNNEKNLEVVISDVVKGGVICNIKGIRAFIPASQLSVSFVSNLDEYKGETLKVKIIELDLNKKRVILSRREVEQKELEKRKKELLHSIKKNDRMTGTVKKLTNFGAFVDLGGIDGLIHINDLSWTKVKHPSDVVKTGDTVDVYVIDIDVNKERIALGLKDVNDDPWNNITKKYIPGQIYEGTVERFRSFGAFVLLETGIEGLVHLSEISEDRVDSPEDVLSIGDTIKVKLMDINEKGRKIRLSIKEAASDLDREELNKFNDESEATTSLKDVFKSVLKDIE